jgi:hypothetical protein
VCVWEGGTQLAAWQPFNALSRPAASRDATHSCLTLLSLCCCSAVCCVALLLPAALPLVHQQRQRGGWCREAAQV